MIGCFFTVKSAQNRHRDPSFKVMLEALSDSEGSYFNAKNIKVNGELCCTGALLRFCDAGYFCH